MKWDLKDICWEGICISEILIPFLLMIRMNIKNLMLILCFFLLVQDVAIASLEFWEIDLCFAQVWFCFSIKYSNLQSESKWKFRNQSWKIVPLCGNIKKTARVLPTFWGEERWHGIMSQNSIFCYACSCLVFGPSDRWGRKETSHK